MNVASDRPSPEFLLPSTDFAKATRALAISDGGFWKAIMPLDVKVRALVLNEAFARGRKGKAEIGEGVFGVPNASMDMVARERRAWLFITHFHQRCWSDGLDAFLNENPRELAGACDALRLYGYDELAQQVESVATRMPKEDFRSRLIEEGDEDEEDAWTGHIAKVRAVIQQTVDPGLYRVDFDRVRWQFAVDHRELFFVS